MTRKVSGLVARDRKALRAVGVSLRCWLTHFMTSSTRLLRPVYVPTFHLHAVYLGEREKGMPEPVFAFRQFGFMSPSSFFHLFRVSCGDLRHCSLFLVAAAEADGTGPFDL